MPGAMGYVLDPTRRSSLIEDVWPSLFFGVERVPAIKRKLGSSEWAGRMMQRMVEEADVLIKNPPHLPAGRPGWRHDFYSPRSAEHLVYDPDSELSVDPWDGSGVEGDAQRAAWVLLTHERTYRLMRSLGLIYQVTGNRSYSDWVADGLRRAVEFFEGTPRSESGHGAIYFSPLYDAQVVLLTANAYDLTKESPSYEPGEGEVVLRKIFEGGSRSPLSYHSSAKTHNITCYVSAALAAADTAATQAAPAWRYLCRDSMKPALSTITVWAPMRPRSRALSLTRSSPTWKACAV